MFCKKYSDYILITEYIYIYRYISMYIYIYIRVVWKCNDLSILQNRIINFKVNMKAWEFLRPTSRLIPLEVPLDNDLPRNQFAKFQKKQFSNDF